MFGIVITQIRKKNNGFKSVKMKIYIRYKKKSEETAYELTLQYK